MKCAHDGDQKRELALRNSGVPAPRIADDCHCSVGSKSRHRLCPLLLVGISAALIACGGNKNRAVYSQNTVPAVFAFARGQLANDLWLMMLPIEVSLPSD